MSSYFTDIQHRKVNIASRLHSLRDGHSDVSLLFEKLHSLGDLVLIGGAIRDLAFNRRPRDIDLIVNSTVSDFDSTLSTFNYTKNRFGGYKVRTSGAEFDIWSINNNWAFRENILETSIENIPHGAFFNFDALMYCIDDDHLDVHYFVNSITNNTLDIVLDEDVIDLNPNPDVNIVRAFFIKRKWGLQFSPRVSRYIKNWIESVDEPALLLKQAELRHYGRDINIDKEIFRCCTMEVL